MTIGVPTANAFQPSFSMRSEDDSRAVGEFLAWCEKHGVASIADVAPLHVATWIELQSRSVSAPTVKQQLAALRHLFDWLVTGQIVPQNPAASVRGTRHVVRVGNPIFASALLTDLAARMAASRLRPSIGRMAGWTEINTVAHALLDREFNGKAVLTLA